MDVVERREKLATKENPDSRMDYVSSLQGRLAAAGAAARITLRYVPDRWIVTPDGFDAYLAGLGDQDWANLESLATAILDDINNEVVARWVQVVVDRQNEAEDGVTDERHSVMLEDRQPKWGNDALLSRLRLL